MRPLAISIACVFLLAGSALSADSAAVKTISPAGSRVSFARAITFPTDVGYPISIAAGDLNRDGFPDLAVVSSDGGGAYPFVSYALGNGDGTFRQWQIGPATTAPGCVLLADVTGNRKLDALTTDAISSDMDIAFGNGKGGFSSNEDIKNVGPIYLAVADVNHDGIPDVVGSGGGPDSVFVMLGQGNKKFSQPMTFPSGGNSPSGVAVGDLNHDGIPDMVVANSGDLFGKLENLSVLLGRGKGKLGQPQTYNAGPNPVAVVLGDFNGDGNLDAAVSNNIGVDVLLGKGDGTFAAAANYPTGGVPTWIVAADFNGDGILDLAVSTLSNSSDYVAVLLGKGDGTFQRPRKFGVGLIPWQLVVADFNHDGWPDIATVNNGDSTVSVLLNTTKFPTPRGSGSAEGNRKKR